MKKSTRLAAIVAAMAVTTSMVLAGCGNSSSGSSTASKDNSSGSTTTSESGESGGEVTVGRNGDVWVNANGDEIDISKHVDLTVYTIFGGGGTDTDMVNDAANKLNEELVNATVDVQVMNDWRTRYNLALSSGEKIDLIWTAMWYQYQPFAYDGAWYDITNMVDETVPELRDLIGEDSWKQCRIDGKDYAIPSMNMGNSQWGVAWREDLRKEMGCSEITDMASMEEYAQAILENHPEMIPYCESASGGLFHSLSEKSHTFIGLGNPQFSYGVGYDPAKKELYQWDTTDWFREYCHTMRDWIVKGYCQPDIGSTTDDSTNGILTGKYAGSVCYTPGNMPRLIDSAEALGWEVDYMSYGEMYQWTYWDSPVQMSYAIPASSENPERTLMWVYSILTNDELYNIYDCGIEGTHYELDDEGHYVSLNDATNPGYVQSGLGLTSSLFNKDAKHYTKSYQWVLDYYDEAIEPYLIENVFQNFPEDYTEYSDLQTANNEVSQQYKWPVIRGAMDNVDEALDDALARQDAAGRQEIIAHVKEQFADYLAGLE
ncbi:MAG: DUF3502 domain-containing protein [Oscillospiraceae bacterium]|nr:DUF3502 domain-containing protein [Oscillospiraceae bacterium]